MTSRPRLKDDERAILRGRSPGDSTNKPTSWLLGNVVVMDEEWSDEPFELINATIEDVLFERWSWRAPGVFRRGTFRRVTFNEVALMGLRFEDVSFDECHLGEVAMDGCVFVRCRFMSGVLHGWRALRCRFVDCSWVDADLRIWDLDRCAFSGGVLDGTIVSGLRASECEIQLRLTGGAVASVDLRACPVEALDIVDAEVRGFRALDSEFGRLSFRGTGEKQIAIGRCRLGELTLGGCTVEATLSLVESSVRMLRIEDCSSLQCLVIKDTSLDGVAILRSMLVGATFEGVEARGEARIAASTLSGIYFCASSWSTLSLDGVSITDYLAVDDSEFTALVLCDVRQGDGVQRRLEEVRYGDGSMRWGVNHGR